MTSTLSTASLLQAYRRLIGPASGIIRSINGGSLKLKGCRLQLGPADAPCTCTLTGR